MPNRIVRDGILSSEPVALLSWAEEVFYRRLLSVADDHGRFHSTPKLIRSACYPLLIDKVSDSDIGKWLAACATAGLVRVYPASDGKRYLEIVKFGQQVRSKSKFPEAVDPGGGHSTSDGGGCDQMISGAHLDEVVFGDVVVTPSSKVTRAAPALTVDDLVQDGLSPETAVAWIEHRKAKKAKLTPLAWSGFIAESVKAGWRLEDAVKKSIARNWTSFEAKWVAEDRGPGAKSFAETDREASKATLDRWTGGLVTAKPKAPITFDYIDEDHDDDQKRLG